MSERFVRGWKVSPKKLAALVGSELWTPAEVLKSRANRASREDVVMTLGDGERAEGTKAAREALGAILGGKLDREHAYEYARVLELVLNHGARPLSSAAEILLQLTYHVPNDTPGCWNPILRSLKLPKLAKVWAATNLTFPWKRGPNVDWPMWTILAPETLVDIGAELKTVTRKKVDAIPAKLLVDPDRSWLDDARQELFEGLVRLRKWVDAARAPERSEGPLWSKTQNALVLSMDGDQ